MALPSQAFLRSFWMDPPDALAHHNATGPLPAVADIVIIGSGYAGAAVTHFLQRSCADAGDGPLDIVMLEARESCSGATGRNGGHLKPDTYYSYLKYRALHGAEEAERLLQFEAAQVDAVARLIRDEAIDCDFQLTRAIDVYKVRSEADHARRALQSRKDDGGDVGDIKVLDASEIAACGFKDVEFAVSYTAGQVHPYKLIHSLLRTSLSRGLRLFTHAPVTSARRDHVSGNWTLTTPDRGTIVARQVVFATNGYTGSLLPDFRQYIVPVRGTACRITHSPLSLVTHRQSTPPHVAHTPPPPSSSSRQSEESEKSSDPKTYTYGIRWRTGESDYLITRHDHSSILGGAKQTFLHDLESWYDNTDDSELISPASVDHFKQFMLRETNVRTGTDQSGGGSSTETVTGKVERVWTGVLGYSTDLLPWIGPLPPRSHSAASSKDEAKTQPELESREGGYILAGFHGHGMPRILGCAKFIADLISRDRREKGDCRDRRDRGDANCRKDMEDGNGIERSEGRCGAGEERVMVPKSYLITRDRFARQGNEILPMMGRTTGALSKL